MSRPTTGSVNIASLDSLIVADLCEGKFFVDITPSVFIGDGDENGLGVKVQITSPIGVIIKPYTDTFDIEPPFVDVFEYSIPTQAGNYQYGTYKVAVEFTDADGTVYDLEKTLRICEPDKKNKTKKWGSLSATLKGVCKDGKVHVSVDGIPNYNGKEYSDSTNALTLEYPTSSGLDVLDTTHPRFTVQLYEGEYKVTGTLCASYNYGDNVFVKVLYKVKKIKSIKCIIDESCVAAAMNDLYLQTKSECSEAAKEQIRERMDEGFRLLKLAQMMAENGEDASDVVEDLETVLGCKCTCNCEEGTPIINNNPSTDVSFEGCGFEEEQVGLTKVITINNYDYELTVPVPNGGAFTVTEPALDQDGCKKTQEATFNITNVYNQILAIAAASGEQSLLWAQVLRGALTDLDLACLNITSEQLQAMTFTEVMQVIANKTCAGGTCDAEITSASTERVGADVVLSFASEDAESIDIYLDDILVVTVLSSITEYTFVGAADGEAHIYKLFPKCTNGITGTPYVSDEFTYIGCPDIAPPNISDTNVSDAACPFDLTSLEGGVASGVTVEWHNANNTLNKSLVADPEVVTSGVYYAFAKLDDCYSIGVAVTVVCSAETDCTAPQSLIVATITGGNRVSFLSATYPPPSNSYTVKRRLYADADVTGSYTTIGTPSFNSSSNRWEILDDDADDNTLYVYRAYSNCSSPAPSADYTYANITCPTLSLTAGSDTLDYSFTGVGGDIDKYQVKLYNAAGTSLIHTDTHLPAFSNPITGTFIYLDADSSYKVRVRVFIGTYYKDCDFVTAQSETENYTIASAYNFSIDEVTGSNIPDLAATGLNTQRKGHHTGMSGTYNVDVSGTIVQPIKLVATVDGIPEDEINISATGTYALSITATESEDVIISINLQ